MTFDSARLLGNHRCDNPFRNQSVNRKTGVLAAVYIAVLAINLDITIVNVALPSIDNPLHADTRGLQWVVDGYNLSFAALVLAAGSLSEPAVPATARNGFRRAE
jgi:MFS family permease